MAYNMPSRASQLLRQLSAADFYAQDLKLAEKSVLIHIRFAPFIRVFSALQYILCVFAPVCYKWDILTYT